MSTWVGLQAASPTAGLACLDPIPPPLAPAATGLGPHTPAPAGNTTCPGRGRLRACRVLGAVWCTSSPTPARTPHTRRLPPHPAGDFLFDANRPFRLYAGREGGQGSIGLPLVGHRDVYAGAIEALPLAQSPEVRGSGGVRYAAQGSSSRLLRGPGVLPPAFDRCNETGMLPAVCNVGAGWGCELNASLQCCPPRRPQPRPLQVFGLHANADIAYYTSATKDMWACLTDMQPRTGTSGGSGSADAAKAGGGKGSAGSRDDYIAGTCRAAVPPPLIPIPPIFPPCLQATAGADLAPDCLPGLSTPLWPASWWRAAPHPLTLPARSPAPVDLAAPHPS
jgi:hypothetical protein